eukprot:6193387-Pleurochrysis_carterae.AAC.3
MILSVLRMDSEVLYISASGASGFHFAVSGMTAGNRKSNENPIMHIAESEKARQMAHLPNTTT